MDEKIVENIGKQCNVKGEELPQKIYEFKREKYEKPSKPAAPTGDVR